MIICDICKKEEWHKTLIIGRLLEMEAIGRPAEVHITLCKDCKKAVIKMLKRLRRERGGKTG